MTADTSARRVSVTGYHEKSGERILLDYDSAFKTDVQKQIYGKPLRGLITERNEDTISILIFPIRNDSVKNKLDPVRGNDTYVNSLDSGKTFYLKINKWKKTWQHHYVKDIPYRNKQFMALNFPIRLNLGDGTVETAFTNAAISLVSIYGKARIYKSDYLEPRYRYWGWGGMFGVGARENENAKNEFSVIGGVTLTGSIYGIKLVLASGLESGLSSNSKKASLFLGIGFGVDIYQLIDPEIHKKE